MNAKSIRSPCWGAAVKHTTREQEEGNCWLLSTKHQSQTHPPEAPLHHIPAVASGILLPTLVSMLPYRAVGIQEHPTQHHPLLFQQGHFNSSWLGFPLCKTGIKLQSWQRSENLNSLMSLNPSEVLIRKAQQKRKVLSLIQTDLPLEISPFEL